ncbi:deoxynucleoside kinase [Roseisolibacter sp. H3M3-2]|uniref:deoxynucleoside kinase n=1 Tax=Roseisolibacter sp. H3M3-2 TaxID=3031323 RepID=UPI0023DB7AD5|nr:deoxynucleoside kinase [Roseisolibacter sp. H3M3-2]MDF1504641.1 deoxynucleoside kinase [Roseisolibacter sp. H3M3-2]
MLIGVAGMVGAGKSTLTRALAARFGLQLAPESVGDDNPWLEPYYARGAESRREYALRLQLHFLATRFESMRRIRGAGGSWVLDRTWYEDAEVFARGLHEEGLMGAAEWTLYLQLYGELLHSPAARPPRLLVYLHGPLDVIVERIARRGRPKESDTDVAYWAALHRRYEQWIAGFRRCPVLSIDVRDYDLVADPQAIEAVAARVRRRLEPELPQTELWPAAEPERGPRLQRAG